MLEGCSEPLELWRVCSAGSRGDLLLLEIGRRDFMLSAYHRYHLITISFINLVRVGDVHTLHTPRERALVHSKAPLVPLSLTAAIRGSSEDRAGGQRPRSGGCSDCNPATVLAGEVGESVLLRNNPCALDSAVPYCFTSLHLSRCSQRTPGVLLHCRCLT